MNKILMNKIKMLLMLLFLIQQSNSFAQIKQEEANKGIRISLITCGRGEEIYSVFGHTALRILDSASGEDIVYNYGTFDGYEENFELKFMRGKLLYYLSEESYDDFVGAYQAEGRWVKEQILDLNKEQKDKIHRYLRNNMLPENRAYHYDFFFDNCATRIRDIFSKNLEPNFTFPELLGKEQKITFREIINRYLRQNEWERLGINIVLGSKIDAKMSNDDLMFLPDYLMDAAQKAQIDNHPLVDETIDVVSGKLSENETLISVPTLVLVLLLTLFLCGFFFPNLNFLSVLISNLMLFLTGLLGVIILTMWFATDHQTCSNNFNLLWALPTNLFFIFRKKQFKYALIGMLLILLSFGLHVLKIQQILLPEMLLLILLQLLVLGNIYRKYSTLYAKNSSKK